MNLLDTSSPRFQAEYLRTLPAIRERCSRVFDLAKAGKLEYFDYHPDQEAAAVEYCAGIIQRDFGTNYASIPPHSRWKHFEVGEIDRVSPMVAAWKQSSSPPNDVEIAKRLIDVCLVSVLLDAGAGNSWVFNEPGTNLSVGRSEGLAVASLHAFEAGAFSSDPSMPYRADAKGLEAFSVDKATSMFQVDTISNPMSGLEGRANLLVSLGHALKSRPEFFGEEGRPGNMIDYLAKEAEKSDGRSVPVAVLFHILIDGLGGIWPARLSLGGISLGDVWPCQALASTETPETSSSTSARGEREGSGADRNAGAEILVPFHKLTQWLTYSLIVPLESTLGWSIDGMEDMTGLPEYRNGGLFVDLGVLSLKRDKVAAFYPGATAEYDIPRFPPSHPAIVEWRAMTVMLLDRVLEPLRSRLAAPDLTLLQVLESATWKGGREIAKTRRPTTGGPPIDIESDGTVF